MRSEWSGRKGCSRDPLHRCSTSQVAWRRRTAWIILVRPQKRAWTFPAHRLNGGMSLVQHQFNSVAPFDISNSISTAVALAAEVRWQAEFRPDGISFRPWQTPKKSNAWPWERKRPESADHVLNGPRGWLLGYDSGEFGGGLVELDSERSCDKLLSLSLPTLGGTVVPQNVRGLASCSGKALVLRGLNHLGINEGTIELYKGELGTGVALDGVFILPASPQAFHAATDGIVMIAVRQGLLEFNTSTRTALYWAPKRMGERLDTGRQWTSSSSEEFARCNQDCGAWRFPVHHVAWDEKELFAASGPLLVQLKRNDEGYEERWLVERGSWLEKNVLAAATCGGSNAGH